MEKNSANHLTYFLSVPLGSKDSLSGIRHWENLKMGVDDNLIWIKDLTYQQAHSIEVKSIGEKSVYYSKDNKLFPLGKLLPERNVPSVLWTPVERALPVTMPSLNNNYFGLDQQLSVQLVPSDTEQEGFAMMIGVKELSQYIQTSSAVRLNGLVWLGINEQTAVLIGTPLLPLNGKVLWRKNNFLIPVGYDLEWPILQASVQEVIDPANISWIIWNEESKYFTLAKMDFRPLSLSSFRKTLVKH